MLKFARLLNCFNNLRCQTVGWPQQIRAFALTQKLAIASSKNEDNELESEKPIKYFGSEAASWRAKDTRSGGRDKYLWYQPYVISGSLAVFLIYFCILREENDIDLKLSGNIYDQVEGLEQVALTVSYRYNKEHGLDTQELEKRLVELGVDVEHLEAQLTAGH